MAARPLTWGARTPLGPSVCTATSVWHLGLRPAVRLDRMVTKFSLVPASGSCVAGELGRGSRRAGRGRLAAVDVVGLERELKATTAQVGTLALTSLTRKNDLPHVLLRSCNVTAPRLPRAGHRRAAQGAALAEARLPQGHPELARYEVRLKR